MESVKIQVELIKAVFPDREIVGWYKSGEEVRKEDMLQVRIGVGMVGGGGGCSVTIYSKPLIRFLIYASSKVVFHGERKRTMQRRPDTTKAAAIM